MRGHDEQTTHMFSYLSPEQRVPADHPLRAVRALTDEALLTMSRRFASLYAHDRASVDPTGAIAARLVVTKSPAANGTKEHRLPSSTRHSDVRELLGRHSQPRRGIRRTLA